MTFFAKCRALVARLGLLGAAVAVTVPAHAQAFAYAEALSQAVGAMEAGKHAQAAAPLKAALSLDRNEPLGVIALGTLYLHTGSSVRAKAEFERAQVLAPDDALAGWGTALAGLAQGKRDVAVFDALNSDTPARNTVAAYVRLLNNDIAGAQNRLGVVTAEEADFLRLQVGAFIALRAKNTVQGEALMAALLARPGMDRLAEDAALVLPFEPDRPAEAGAPPLLSAIGFPAGPANPLAGRVTLGPGKLPADVAFVSYSVDGGGFAATTNYAPWTSDWNTARLPNGLYTLRMTAHAEGTRLLHQWSRTVQLRNPDAPRSQRLAPAQAADLRGRLQVLLAPRPSRKAAHFALAEGAAARGDGATARKHIEAVVAVDPLFRNARASLRRYNLATGGAQSGIWQVSTRQKIVALTFDDGPHPRRTPLLLDALAKEKAQATFFVVGVRVEQSPDLVRRMASEQHEVANHSYSHQNLALLSAPAVERELCRTSVLIHQATGTRPRFYRPPGGNVNKTVADAAEAMGMAGGYWTVAATKHEEAASAKALTRYVVDKARPGAILLLHNAPDVTIAALPGIVRGLRARGFTLVTLSELVRRAKNGSVALAAKQSKKPT